MPYDYYEIHVSVDGVPIPDNSMCRYSSLCIFTVSLCATHTFIYLCFGFVVVIGFFYHLYFNSFQTVWYRTPTIESLSPVSGPPGNVCAAFSYFTEFTLNFC